MPENLNEAFNQIVCQKCPESNVVSRDILEIEIGVHIIIEFYTFVLSC